MNLSRIFEHFAKKVKNFSDEEITNLEKGNFDIFLKSNIKKSQNLHEPKKNFDLKEIKTKLEKSSSREESSSILLSQDLTVVELSKIAKELDIPVRKGEKKEQLIERIVEKTVGFRLNSEAVRGNTPEAKPTA